MSHEDLLGYAAGLAVIATYSMSSMVPLRILGIGSNLLFISYGLLAGATPVLVLHMILLPLNGWRLWQLRQSSASPSAHGRASPRLQSPTGVGAANLRSAARRRQGRASGKASGSRRCRDGATR